MVYRTSAPSVGLNLLPESVRHLRGEYMYGSISGNWSQLRDRPFNGFLSSGHLCPARIHNGARLLSFVLCGHAAPIARWELLVPTCQR
jgi:hypothetical protein